MLQKFDAEKGRLAQMMFNQFLGDNVVLWYDLNLGYPIIFFAYDCGFRSQWLCCLQEVIVKQTVKLRAYPCIWIPIRSIEFDVLSTYRWSIVFGSVSFL